MSIAMVLRPPKALPRLIAAALFNGFVRARMRADLNGSIREPPVQIRWGHRPGLAESVPARASGSQLEQAGRVADLSVIHINGG